MFRFRSINPIFFFFFVRARLNEGRHCSKVGLESTDPSGKFLNYTVGFANE